MKIAHVITRLIVGGAQDNTLLTVERHDREKYEVHVISNASGAWGDRAKEVADVYHDLPDLVNPISPVHDLRALVKLVAIMRRERYDIVHTHSSKAGVLGRIAARLAGVPCVVHTIHGFSFHPFMPRWKRTLFEGIERSLDQRTDATITVSEINRQEAISLGVIREVTSRTIYSGIDFSGLDAPFDEAGLREELNLPVGTPTVINVGRVDELKDPLGMIDAFALLLPHVPNAVLLMVGDGPLFQTLREKVAAEGLANHVRLLGSRADVAALLRLAHVFALSTKLEGLGRAMTEAMLVGVPPVVPNIYGIPEIVHHDQTGWLYAVSDMPALASGIVTLLQDPVQRTRLGAAAKALTRTTFGVNEMVRHIEALYDEAYNRRNQASGGEAGPNRVSAHVRNVTGR